MTDWLSIICDYAPHAYWIIFCLLLLAGFCLPISEDVLLLTAGALAATCIPDSALHLYLWVYAGCIISGWQVYWIGRLFGPKLYDFPLFRNVLTPKKVEKLHHYYEKFGFFTFLVGRFVPGGVRNALFLTSGLGKMPFHKFMLRDGVACLISSMTLFFIGFTFADNYDIIVGRLETAGRIILGIISIAVITLLIWLWRWKSRKINNEIS